MKISIWEYFEDYEFTYGYAKRVEEEKRLYRLLLTGRKEEFLEYCNKNEIDLDYYTPGNAEDDFDLWEEKMATYPL